MEQANTPALLLLDLPPSALAGIDLLAFTTTPRFKGVKNLPSGLHFTYVGSSTAFSERHGLWFRITGTSQHASRTQLIVTKWTPESEVLALEIDDAENMRWRANLGRIWRDGLTPYRQTATDSTSSEAVQESVDWPSLTSRITDDLLARITSTTDWTLSSASSAKRDLEDIPGLTRDESVVPRERELYFLPIDLKQTWRVGATGRERTTAAQDRSWSLNDLITAHCRDGDANDILGELQFCYLMVLTLNNFSCLEQWRRLLTLLLTCQSGIAVRPALFADTLAVLLRQLQHCRLADNGLIDLADEGGSLLRDLLTRFRKALEILPGAVQDVADALDELEEYLHEQHGWQFGGSFAKAGVLELEDGERVHVETTAFDEDDETGEYAPQIVELTPQQASMLGAGEDSGRLQKGMGTTSLSEDEHVEEEEDEDEEEETQDLEGMDSRY